MKYTTVLGNKDLQDKLVEINFKPLGSGWFGNESGNIRIRLWRDCSVDFWLWEGDEEIHENMIYFRGRIHSFDDVIWVLDRCFDVKIEK